MPNLTIPNTFTNGVLSDAPAVNANFTAVATLLNSTGLDSDGLAANSVISSKILDSNVTTSKILNANVTTAKLADASVTSAKKAALGENLSVSSSTGFGTTVLLGAASLTTVGRPVMIMLQPDGSTNPGYLSMFSSAGAITEAAITITLSRDASTVAVWKAEITGPSSASLAMTALASLSFIDTGATAGAHSWQFLVEVTNPANMGARAYYLKTVAFEL